jgi:hypothetical protein
MSADNAIIIGKFGDKYRVAHVQASENLDWEGIDSPYARVVQWDYFHDAVELHDMEGASEYAFAMAREIENDGGYVEYGVGMMDFGCDFPDKRPPEPNWN